MRKCKPWMVLDAFDGLGDEYWTGVGDGVRSK